MSVPFLKFASLPLLDDLQSHNEYLSGAFVALFEFSIEAAKKNNTELYCGEYGVIDVVSPEDTVKWYKEINQVLNKYGIARSAWSYKEMDFGLSDARLDSVRKELLLYL